VNDRTPKRSSRSRQLGAVLWLSSMALAAPAGGKEPEAPEVVAQVGDTEVTAAELRAYLGSLPPGDQAALAKDPALLSQSVRGYLARRLVLKAAQARQWDRQPAVQAQLQRVQEETLAELYLQSVSQPPPGYPSEAEVEAAYQARPGAFELPPQYRLAQIFIADPRTSGAQDKARARERLDAVVKKLEARDADFAAVARERSEERASADNGGEIGWLSEAQLVPGIRASVTGLSRGAVSKPVRLDEGWHVLKLLESRPASRLPLAEARPALVAQLRSERAQANRRAYLARLLEQSPPIVNELGISKLLQAGP
jgi:parvulin-like peptidyl-prolyl isomerase